MTKETAGMDIDATLERSARVIRDLQALTAQARASMERMDELFHAHGIDRQALGRYLERRPLSPAQQKELQRMLDELAQDIEVPAPAAPQAPTVRVRRGMLRV